MKSMLLEAEVQTVANCVVEKEIGKKLEGGSYTNEHEYSAARNNISFVSTREVSPTLRYAPAETFLEEPP